MAPAPGFIGLANPGSTCFFNAPVQCLMHIDALHDYFHHDWNRTPGAELQNDKSFTRCYYNLQCEMDAIPPNGYVKPTAFLKAISGKFPHANNQQHDACELLVYLLEGLHNELIAIQMPVSSDNWQLDDSRNPCAAELMRLPAPAASIITRLFRLTVCETTTCGRSECLGLSNCSYAQLVLDLPFPREKVGEFSLSECLHHWSFTPVPWTGECQRCHVAGFCSRTYTISQLPRFLILSVPILLDHRVATDRQFDFPEKIDIADCLGILGSTGAVICELKAVIRHFGTNAHGHFIPWIRIGSSWYSFNDHLVTESTLQASLRRTGNDSHVSMLVYECPGLAAH